MDELDLEGLRGMLGTLPKRERNTAQACWESYHYGDWDDPPMGGIEWAARAYKLTLAGESPSKARRTPHEVEKELRRLAASARDLMVKVQQISQECLDLVENAAVEATPFVPSEWIVGQHSVQHPDLHAWFQMRRGHYCEDGSLEEDEPWWGKDGMRPLELQTLANACETLADQVATRKQAPNGPRSGFTGRRTPLEYLLFSTARMASFRMCPMAHVIPIARKVHEWATGEAPGGEWGKRPFEHVLPLTKKLTWDEPEEIRLSHARLPWQPRIVIESRAVRLKQALRDQVERLPGQEGHPAID